MSKKKQRVDTPSHTAKSSVAEMFNFSVIRTLRKREGWTLAELSARTGVSMAVISKLERNQTTAELPTLFALSRAFGLTVTDILHLAEARTAHLVNETMHTSGAFTFREAKYGNVRALLGTARAGASVSTPKVHHDDFELCWILSGRVCVDLPNERHDLRAGQSIQFDAVLTHTYLVLEDCEIIILHLRKPKRF